MITFDGRTLDDFAQVTLSMSREADPAPPAQPTKYITTFTIGGKVYEPRGSQVWDRIQALQNLCETPEAELVITDDSGSVTTHRAKYVSDNTAEVIARGKGELQMVFRTYELYDDNLHDALTATFTPSGGAGKVYLTNVSGWAEQVAMERYHRDHNARQRSTVTIDFVAQPRETMPDPLDTRGNRLTSLTTNAGTMTGMLTDAVEGTLVYGSFSQVVRLDSIKPVTDDNLEHVSYAITASYVMYPSGTYAQASYSTSTSEACETGATTLTVSGTIEASSQAEAATKLTELRTLYQTTSNRMTKESTEDNWIDAEDTTGSTWLERSFTLEFETQKTDFTGWSLSINTSQDVEGGTASTVYSGEVHAETLSTARTKARELGLFTTMALSNSTETADYQTDCDGTQKFVSFSFSYEYATNNEFVGGNVSFETNTPSFGEITQTISGSISAPTSAQAKTKAKSLLPSGCLLRDKRENVARKVNATSGTTFESFDFSYTLVQNRGTTSTTNLRYNVSTTPDFTAMTETVSYSGNVAATNEAAAEAAITDLINAQTTAGGNLETQQISHRYEKTGTNNCYLGTDFSFAHSSPLDAPGNDLITATYTIDRKESRPHTILTPVLFGAPVAQTLLNTWTGGEMRLNAQCTARNKATALAWGQALRSKVSTANGAGAINGVELNDSGQETLQHFFTDKDQTSTTPVRYEYRLSLVYAYPTGLTGLMPA